MNIFERFFALILIIVVTGCGAAKFQGNGANKSKNVDDRGIEPVVCGEANPCPDPCKTALTENKEDSASQNAAVNSTTASQNPGQNMLTATCPVDESEDDASQNNDHPQS